MKTKNYTERPLNVDEALYVRKHLNRANKILGKAIGQKQLMENWDINRLRLIEINEDSTLGCCIPTEHKIGVAPKYLEHMCKTYSVKLLRILLHELLHYYVYLKYETRYADMCTSCVQADSSPIFMALVDWFNFHLDKKYKIGSNGNLSYMFNLCQYQLVDKLKQDISFQELDTTLRKYKLKLKEVLNEVTWECRFEGKPYNLHMDWTYAPNSESNTYVEVEYVQCGKFLYKDITLYVGMTFNPYEELEIESLWINLVDEYEPNMELVKKCGYDNYEDFACECLEFYDIKELNTLDNVTKIA